MTNAREQAWLDQEDEMVAQTIRKYGVFIEYVYDCEGSSTPFAYTVGLFGLGHPELLVLGVDTTTASALLNEVAGRVRAGQNLLPGEVLSFDDWAHRVTVEVVPNPEEIVFAANRHAQRPPEASVPALVLTYDDKAGRFPWDEGTPSPRGCSHVPGRSGPSNRAQWMSWNVGGC